MEKINKELLQGVLQTSSQNTDLLKYDSSFNVDIEERQGRSICAYKGEQTSQEITRAMALLTKTYKNQLDDDFLDVLVQRIIEKQMPDKLIRDAVNYVIDTCKYPPKLADILSFGRVKLYTHKEYCDECYAGDGNNMFCVKKGKNALWVKISECEQYGINPEILIKL